MLKHSPTSLPGSSSFTERPRTKTRTRTRTIHRITIAIDGPSGAGKSTVARRIASELGYTYIDTGAMYRAVAWLAIQGGITLSNENEMIGLARESTFRFEQGDPQRVIINGHDVTQAIRTPEVTQLSSPVSAIPGVRRALVAQQQAMGQGGGVVMEGRDIGTVVFPNAEVKVFLTASEHERGRRRWLERKAKGDDCELDVVIQQQRERDIRDSSRADSPLMPADDSDTLDSDGLTIDEVVERIISIARERGAC